MRHIDQAIADIDQAIADIDRAIGPPRDLDEATRRIIELNRRLAILSWENEIFRAMSEQALTNWEPETIH